MSACWRAPGQVKNLPGRPERGPPAWRWLAACFERGPVTGCLAAAPGFGVIGEHTRYRGDLTAGRTGDKQRAGKPGESAAVKVSPVITGLHAMTGPDIMDVHPTRQPKRTRIARSLVDAAAWMPTDRGAAAILAAGVQQRLVRVEDLRQVVDRIETLHRRGLMTGLLADIAGGAQALSELDFTRQVVRRHRLPEPTRQVARRDERGRRRWIDVMWDEWKIIVEIDGAQHTDPLQRWDDIERDNGLEVGGYLTLRFPSWLVRNDPEYVAREILRALRRNGYRG